MIKHLDFDDDDKIGLKDLRKYCDDNSLAFSEEETEAMIKDANILKYSYLTTFNDLDKYLYNPLTLNDLKAEMRWTVQWDRERKEHFIAQRIHSLKWRSIADKLGEVLPPAKFDPPNFDVDELRLPQIYNNWKTMTVTEKPKKIIPDVFKAEAGVMLVNTMSINPKEKRVDENKEPTKNPLEAVVNLRINRDSRMKGNPTISFVSQKYYDEG